MVTNKVIAVTGASSGIGEAAALHLAGRGAKLILGARDADKLAALAERIAAAGGEAVHVRNPEVRTQIETFRDRFAMPPEAVARAIAYAVEQPDDVNVGEIVIRSTAQP